MVSTYTYLVDFTILTGAGVDTCDRQHQCDQMKESKSAKFSKKVAISNYIQIVTHLKWPRKFEGILTIIVGKIVTKTFQK